MVNLPDRLPSDELPPRELEREVFDASVDESNRRDAELLSKLSVLAVGMHIFGRKTGRNILGTLVDIAGAKARFIGGLSKKKGQETISGMLKERYAKALEVSVDGGGAVLARSWGGARLDDIEGVRSIIDSLGVIYDPKNAASAKALDKGFLDYFSSFPRSSTSAESFFHHDLQRVTFGDLLDDSNRFVESVMTSKWSSKASLELSSIREAIKRNWITADTIIDPKLFWSKTGATRASKKIVDMRMLDPRHALNALVNMTNMAGLTRAVSSVFGNVRQIGILGRKTPTSANQIFIGGNVFEMIPGRNLKKIASGQRLGSISDVLHIPAVLRDAKAAGKLAEMYERPPLIDSPIGRLQEKLGVGTRFQLRPGGFIQTIRKMTAGIRGVGSGQAIAVGKKYKKSEQSLFNIVAGDQIVVPDLSDLDVVTLADKGAGSKFFLQAGRPLDLRAGGAKTVWTKEGDKFVPRQGHLGAWEALVERVKLYAGTSPNAALIKSGSVGKRKLAKEDLFLPFKGGGLASLERTTGRSQSIQRITQAGMADYTERALYYATNANPLDKTKDFVNYLSIRLNSLASSSLLGIGFRPSPSVVGNLMRVAAIPAIYFVGVEAAKYVDYKIGDITGIRPSHALADTYTQIRIGQQSIRELTGVGPAASYVEDMALPGVKVGLIGTIGAIIAGAKVLEKTGSFGKALGLAGAIYGAVGGPNVGQTADALKRVYSGEDKVPIRQSRFWMLGYQPFFGGKIDHFSPSWYLKFKKKPGITNVYGSEENYWKYGSLLPTLENWLHLRTAIDPYAVEKMNYYKRPYPITGGLGEGLPIIGPLVADTLGAIIKPRVRMHANYQQSNLAVASANVKDRGVPPGAAARLGIPELSIARIELDRPDLFESRMRKYANVALEPAGIWKYALEHFGVKIDERVREASSHDMTSLARSYYGAGLGGAFGETEFIRRFLLADYSRPSKINQQLNPIPNAAPRWLPGSLSENPADRGYFRDFTRGDPYTILPGGEYRLPGAGYEAVNKLHSGKPGEYDAVDRFLILADIAPFSQGYYKYKTRALRIANDPETRARIQQAEENRDKKLDRYGFGKYRQQALAASNMDPITRAIRGMYTGASERILSEIPLVGSKMFPKKDPLEHYTKFQVEGDTFSDWKRPWETIMRPALYDVVGENPIMAAAKAVGLVYLGSSGVGKWLNPIQALAYPANKMSLYMGAAAAGTFGSTFRMATTGQISGGFVPAHVEDERELAQYFDNLKYKKYSTLARLAESKAEPTLAKMFRKQASKTHVYGLAQLNATGNLIPYISTLGPVDRTYFDAFVQESKEKQDRIMKVVPGHMREALLAIRGQGKGPMNVDESVAEYFEEHYQPADDWMGWHPDVPFDAVQIRAIQEGINGISDNVHRFGFYPSQEREVSLRFPFLDDFPSNINATDFGASLLQDVFGRINLKRFSFGTGPSIDSTTVNLLAESTDSSFYFMNDVYNATF